jgi:hypothetical protein
MKAVHGGKNKNDSLDSKHITDLLRSNLFPLAYTYPEGMRAVRDLLRRRQYYEEASKGSLERSYLLTTGL